MKAFTIPKSKMVVPGIRIIDIPEGTPFIGTIEDTTSIFVVLDGTVYDFKDLIAGSIYIDSSDDNHVKDYKPVSLTVSVKE